MVTPLAGVWIEIPNQQITQATLMVTPLAGVWIEISTPFRNWYKQLSLPLRECGLKFCRVKSVLDSRNVTPLAGVWIEMSVCPLTVVESAVTPLAGVWIEIKTCKRQNNDNQVTPLAGVWIEMLS